MSNIGDMRLDVAGTKLPTIKSLVLLGVIFLVLVFTLAVAVHLGLIKAPAPHINKYPSLSDKYNINTSINSDSIAKLGPSRKAIVLRFLEKVKSGDTYLFVGKTYRCVRNGIEGLMYCQYKGKTFWEQKL